MCPMSHLLSVMNALITCFSASLYAQLPPRHGPDASDLEQHPIVIDLTGD